MTVWADSSFLVSLYIEDENTKKAKAYMAANPTPIKITAFSKTEAQHALRMCAFRGDITGQDLTRSLMRLEHDQNEGFFDQVELETTGLFQKTAELSNRYALIHGARYLDVLHVAAALLVKSRRFLTFDKRQGKLAKSAGLEVRP